ncbi:MAG: hypothetical protein ACI85K_001511 [Hyphomicrobiaceae bacterium]|jgi:hypothetical protein
MTKAFLIVNGVLYLALAVWCTVLPTKTSEAIGYSLANNSARSEYIVVYGGLELAMGAFFLLCAFQPGMLGAGLWFALLTYGCLMLFRWATIFTLSDLSTFIYAMVAVETTMTALSAWLVWRSPSA